MWLSFRLDHRQRRQRRGLQLCRHAQRRRSLFAGDIDRQIDRNRPRLGLEQQRESDHANAHQQRRADQAAAGAQAQVLNRIGCICDRPSA
ncbi:MAG: hypothetical protein IV107_21830 [Paucibacter sp.]|nr:hypothetical protein [Roseateles sp.]